MITIVNNGTGNLDAFLNIYQRNNIKARIANNVSDLSDATKLILPGVGSFDKSMENLNKSGMRKSLDYLVKNKLIPVLGVCVGLQIMAKSSEEGEMDGLGWIDAKVEKITLQKSDHSIQSNIPIPHLGWNKIYKTKESYLFQDIEDYYFYFLHSYCIKNINTSVSLSLTTYSDKFISSINNKNIYGVQFHPEKSHKSGEKILLNFANL